MYVNLYYDFMIFWLLFICLYKSLKYCKWIIYILFDVFIYVVMNSINYKNGLGLVNEWKECGILRCLLREKYEKFKCFDSL